ncbi:hypothetical protein J0695_26450, partial [Streptomyces beijiangensis]|nr:hypothetical protein [Streptomyces beijiangensis]
MWELQGHGTVTSGPGGTAGDGPPWFNIRLTFADGTRIDVLAVPSDGRVTIEEMRADPPLSLDGFGALADWIEGPLEDACQVLGAEGPRPHEE